MRLNYLSIPIILIAVFTFVIRQSALASSVDDDQIYFVYPGDDEVNSLCFDQFKLVFWTDSNKNSLRRLFSTVSERFPELFSEKQDARIPLGRVRKFSLNDATAKTNSNGILFSDAFFEVSEDSQVEIFLHELIHFNDCGQFRSLSKDWIEFACPEPGDNSFAERLATFYTRQALRERNKEALEFLKRLFLPTNEYFEFSKHFRNAISAKNFGDYRRAVRELQAAIKVKHEAIIAHKFLIFCHWKLNQNESALKGSATLIKITRSLGLPISQQEIYEATLLRYNLLIAMNKRLDAIKLAQQIVLEKPEEINRFKSVLNGYQSKDHLF